MNHKSMKRSAFKCHINGVMTYKQPLDDEEHRVFATSERALMNICPLRCEDWAVTDAEGRDAVLQLLDWSPAPGSSVSRWKL